MRRPVLLHDKDEILSILSPHRALHIYPIGDLDDFFFPYTCWFATPAPPGGERTLHVPRRELALLYTGAAEPNLLAICPGPTDALRELLRGLLPVLPRQFYLHVTPGAEEGLMPEYTLASHGLHLKMALTDPSRIQDADISGTIPLGPADRPEIEAFYAAGYPGNWFDARMLETGRYFGIREDGVLAAVAGVHVYSPAQKVAALGNIATLPTHRGKGLGRRTTATAVRALLADCDTIGLNVLASNHTAIRLYTELGFTEVAKYVEYAVRAAPKMA